MRGVRGCRGMRSSNTGAACACEGRGCRVGCEGRTGWSGCGREVAWVGGACACVAYAHAVLASPCVLNSASRSGCTRDGGVRGYEGL